MNLKKRIGIWMDYTSAQIYENATGEFLLTSMESNFYQPVKKKGKVISESLIHNEENQTDQAFYNDLMELVKGYDEALLFGPTQAKTALFDLIKANPECDNLYIQTLEADKMTTPQMKAFVKKHFKIPLKTNKPISY